MPEDVVQFGPWFFSKPALDVIIPIATFVLGSILTYITTWHLDNRRWRREKGEKLAEREREAIEKALEWIDPLRNAYSRADFIAGQFIFTGTVTEDQFQVKFPHDILNLFAKREVPTHLRGLLPAGVYRKGFHFNEMFQDAFLEALRLPPRSRGLEVWRAYQPRLDTIKAEIDRLEDDLRAAYMGTFQ